ncbi:MAG: hypothetical protein JWP00_2175 [Chloroflexi bacterium]|jgi:hypothetical protein|nr:hypothetical protein [Chloroflexota bacterium]
MDLKKFNSSPTLEEAATWEGGPLIVHQNVTLLECASEAVLEEALSATPLKYAVVRRISPTVVLVDHGQVPELVKTLSKKGYEPRIVRS